MGGGGGPQEIALIGMSAYLSYLMGDLLGLSGILTLFVCAVAVSHYAFSNISSTSRRATMHAFHSISWLSEGIIFLFVGMDTFDPLKWKVPPSPASRLLPSRYPFLPF